MPDSLQATAGVAADAVPPLVTVTSPAEGFTTTADRVTLVGTVKDVGSGVHHVTCNGQTAALVDGTVRCVIPLLAGVNAAVILAVDGSGNSASAGVRVLREMPAGELTIYPGTLRIGTHEDVVSVTTEAGTVPEALRWTTSDEDTLTLDVYGAGVLVTPHRPGDVVVTAASGGRTATAVVTVLDTEEPLAGELHWAVAPVAGLVPQRPLVVHRTDDESPDVFLIDAYPSGDYSVVRGLLHSGGLRWRGAVPGSAMFADRFGGLIARIGSQAVSRIIGRVDRLDGKPIWQFEARGEIRDAIAAEDGTIYLVERIVDTTVQSQQPAHDMIVVIDGVTGLARARLPVPFSSTTRPSGCTPGKPRPQPSELGPLAVVGDDVYAMLLEAHDGHVPSCEEGRPVSGRGIVASSRQLRVVRVTRTTFENVHILWTWQDSWPDASPRPRRVYDAVPGPVFSTRTGDLVAVWNRVATGADGLLTELHVTTVGGSATTDVVRAGIEPGSDRRFHVLLDAFDAPRLYLSDGSSVEAIDLLSGERKWTAQTPGVPFIAFDDYSPDDDGLKQIALCDADRGLLIYLDDHGDIIRTTPAHITDPRIIVQANNMLHATDPITHAFVKLAFPNDNGSGWFSSDVVDPSYVEVQRRLANLAVN